MSYLLDTNILLCAFQITSPQHRRSVEWLKQKTEAGEAVYSCGLNEVAVARISTRTFQTPAEDVFLFLADLHALPNYQHAELGKAGLKRWRALTLALNLTGNDLNDAYLAALAIERGLTLVTANRGFARFAGAGLKLEVLA